ncbi:CotY/CotZ family spore coat protein [Metabacillus sp. 113a]|uniref:CotY/CotZ family spore coat protein n=1 Tax=Metabacillus sp. 113a TaxID=3404706 RepID=UPI003CF2B55F
MGCGSHLNTGSCVCDILAEIADAQQDNTQDCLGSCSESVRELMGGSAPNYNTVPVQLICNSANPRTVGDGDVYFGGFCGTVFIAQGFKRAANGNNGQLEAATSSFFRVSAVDTETCCAELELLCVTGLGDTPRYGPRVSDLNDCLETVTPLYQRTGICITVDLRCFCGVSCLPAVNASTCPQAPALG